MATPAIQTLITDAQQVLNLKSLSEIRATLTAVLANANVGTPLNPNLTTQQLWDQFYEIVRQTPTDIESILVNQMMKFVFSPPAPGGAGANGQVIFNDGGVLAGDPQFLWNKTTNLLTVTGSATISGDLTVDTSTLKVDSTLNRVGIGTAIPAVGFDVGYTESVFGSSTSSGYSILNLIGTGTGSARYGSIRKNYDSPFDLRIRASNSNSDAPIIFELSNASTAMTLNSTGLCIGVTPSAWAAAVKALQIGAAGAASYDGTNYDISSNRYLASGGTSTYIATGFATMARQVSGTHVWYNAPSGTAGNAITFTQAMMLDASGNLLVGKSSAVATAVGIQFQPAGNSYHTLAASTNADTTLLVYSTGAAAYRFYVGLGGTVFATNTTISAISDARLKENVQDLDVGLGAILALKPRKFDWKTGKGKDIKGDRGFIAQEFETVFPQLVDEWADPAPEGEAPYKSVRQDLIPVLVKAIQELTARVQTLEAK